MAKKMINSEQVEGYVYEHDLAVKVSNSEKTKGQTYINGTLSVATDEEGLNVVQVHYTFVTENTKSGSKNATFTALKKIIDEGKTWVVDGKDAATKVKCSPSLALNEFYGRDDNFVSAKINEGGFVTIVNELVPVDERNTFTTDMLITTVSRVEANPEKNVEEHVVVKGAVFNFRNDLLPVEFVVRNAGGMGYFEDLGATQKSPVFTKVWGRINSTTTTITRTEESAFGEAAVKTYERKSKEWTITGTQKIPYEFDTEETLTKDEVEKMIQDREVYKAEIKTRAEEYKKSHVSGGNTSAPVAAKGGFDF